MRRLLVLALMVSLALGMVLAATSFASAGPPSGTVVCGFCNELGICIGQPYEFGAAGDPFADPGHAVRACLRDGGDQLTIHLDE